MIDSGTNGEKPSVTDHEDVNVLTERSLTAVIEHMKALLSSLIADDTDAAMQEEQFVSQSLKFIDAESLPRAQLIVFWDEYVELHEQIVETAKRTQTDIRQSLQNKNIVGKKIYAYQKMGAYGA